MELPFTTYDVFTQTPFKGNPLAVVTIPASLARPPTQAQKQLIAREFNLSETVFIHDVPDPETNKQRTIDIFLPYMEIPFAGHPTIGSAVSLLQQGVTTLVTRAGPIPIAQTGPNSVRANAPHNVHLHAKTLRHLKPDASAVSADAEIRELELDAPVFSTVKGNTFHLIELPSLDHLSKVKSSNADFPPADLLDEGWQQGFIGRYYYVRTGPSETKDGQSIVSLRTRMMEKTFEDPATGSAACCLSMYLSLQEGKETGSTRYEITQGVEMDKESNIVVEVSVKDSKIDVAGLSGAAVQVMRGFLTV